MRFQSNVSNLSRATFNLDAESTSLFLSEVTSILTSSFDFHVGVVCFWDVLGFVGERTFLDICLDVIVRSGGLVSGRFFVQSS